MGFDTSTFTDNKTTSDVGKALEISPETKRNETKHLTASITLACDKSIEYDRIRENHANQKTIPKIPA